MEAERESFVEDFGLLWERLGRQPRMVAEDGFDVADRLGGVRAPTLPVAGDRDRNFGVGPFRRTAAPIPDGRLVVYEGRGHGGAFTDRRFARDVVSFLKAEDPAALPEDGP